MAFPFSLLITDHSDPDSLGFASCEPISGHGFENNSSELLESNLFLSCEDPSVGLSNNYSIGPHQPVDTSTVDILAVEPTNQAHGIDPLLLTTGTSILVNMSSQFSGIGSYNGSTWSNSTNASRAQTVFNNPFQIDQSLQFFQVPNLSTLACIPNTAAQLQITRNLEQ